MENEVEIVESVCPTFKTRPEPEPEMCMPPLRWLDVDGHHWVFTRRAGALSYKCLFWRAEERRWVLKPTDQEVSTRGWFWHSLAG